MRFLGCLELRVVGAFRFRVPGFAFLWLRVSARPLSKGLGFLGFALRPQRNFSRSASCISCRDLTRYSAVAPLEKQSADTATSVCEFHISMVPADTVRISGLRLCISFNRIEISAVIWRLQLTTSRNGLAVFLPSSFSIAMSAFPLSIAMEVLA